MVAKHVKSAATSAGAQSEGKGQVEAAAKQEVERLRVEPGDPGRRESHEWCRSEGAMLGSEEGPRWTVEERPNLSVNETLFHHLRRLLLPPIFRLTGFGVLHPRCWCLCQFPPRRNLKACILNQSATPLDTLETSDGPPTVRSLSPRRPGACRAPCANNRPSWPSGHFPDSCGRCSTPILPPRNSNWQAPWPCWI